MSRNNGYAMSKLCLRAVTHRHAALNPDIKFFQGCPGYISTRMTGKRGLLGPLEGADVFWWLATTDDLAVLENNGGFYTERKLNLLDDNMITQAWHLLKSVVMIKCRR